MSLLLEKKKFKKKKKQKTKNSQTNKKQTNKWKKKKKSIPSLWNSKQLLQKTWWNVFHDFILLYHTFSRLKESSRSKNQKTVVIKIYIYIYIYSQTFLSYYIFKILALFDPFCVFYSIQIFTITNRQKEERKTITLRRNVFLYISRSSEFQTIIKKDMVKCFSWFHSSVPHVLKIVGI